MVTWGVGEQRCETSEGAKGLAIKVSDWRLSSGVNTLRGK